jgi:uncharacterized protein DUF222
MGTVPVFASASEALAVARAALRFVAAADATAMGTAEQAECLGALEKAHSVTVAARISVLSAFKAGQGYADDGDYSACSWLRYRTRVTHGAAAGHTAWLGRASRHPAVHAALGAEEISEPYAWQICRWTDKLPDDSRAAADQILLSAAASGLSLEDLAGLAAEMYQRSRQDKPDDQGPDGDGDQDGDGADAGFDDRSVKLATTIGGAGVIRGDLTPECAEFVTTVLDALSVPASADDDRTHDQRYHDALQEAMKRLVAAGLVPERAGQPLKVWAHISLADLMLMEGSSALVEQWTAGLRARWAGRRAAADEAGGHQGLWLDGDDAEAIACDAPVTPVVVGEVNPDAFEDLVRLCVQLGGLRHGAHDGQPGNDHCGDGSGSDVSTQDVPAAFGGGLSREALEQAIIGKAVDLLSGPGGLASFLRRRELGARLDGPSLPLDIGYSDTVPAHIRNAVRLRDKHCQWAGRCSQPASACDVHHTKHKADGGKTSVKDCVLLCRYHHHVMIHRRGWTLVVNPDGTTTAWNKDKSKVLHSHGPPARARVAAPARTISDQYSAFPSLFTGSRSSAPWSRR